VDDGGRGGGGGDFSATRTLGHMSHCLASETILKIIVKVRN